MAPDRLTELAPHIIADSRFCIDSRVKKHSENGSQFFQYLYRVDSTQYMVINPVPKFFFRFRIQHFQVYFPVYDLNNYTPTPNFAYSTDK